MMRVVKIDERHGLIWGDEYEYMFEANSGGLLRRMIQTEKLK